MKKIVSVLVILAMLLTSLAACGEEESDTPAVVPDGFDSEAVVVSAGDTALTAGDMSYILNSEYQSFLYELAESGYSPSLVKLDTTLSLHDQEFGMGNGYNTWYEYFADTARTTAEEAVTMASAAKAEGITLSDSELAAIEETLADIMNNAENGETSVEAVLGVGVTEENVRSVLTITALASKYLETHIAAADVSDEAINALYEEYKYSYEKVDYMLYAFDYRDLIGEDATDGEIEAAKEQTRQYADAMAALTTEEDFRAYAKENMTNVLGLTESEAESQFSRNLVVTDASYSEKDELMVWAFSAEVGEVRLEEQEDGVIQMYMLLAYNDREEAITARDVRHILFSHDTYEDDTIVRQVYDEWVENGADIDEFAALAAEYSEDPGSSDNGGLYEAVEAGDMVEEFNDWLFDSDRQVGDHGIVESADYGWHIMYYQGGEPTWRADMIERIQNAAYVEALTSARENHPSETDEDMLGNLPA